jgi:hypothetical protein
MPTSRWSERVTVTICDTQSLLIPCSLVALSPIVVATRLISVE